MGSTSVRIDTDTHELVKQLARELGATVGDTVALAVRRLRQDRIGEQLATDLSGEEIDNWSRIWELPPFSSPSFDPGPTPAPAVSRPPPPPEPDPPPDAPEGPW